MAGEAPVVVFLSAVACGGEAFPMRILLLQINNGCREVGPLRHRMMMKWIVPNE
jgi:hypothetical protein